jgi:hypothetical protein
VVRPASDAKLSSQAEPLCIHRLALCEGRLVYFLPDLAALGFCKLFILNWPKLIIRRLVSIFQADKIRLLQVWCRGVEV